MLAAHSMTFYRVVSVGQVGFDGRSYYRRSCLMQEIACAKPFESQSLRRKHLLDKFPMAPLQDYLFRSFC